jgi:predicted HTH transcriptional regulator
VRYLKQTVVPVREVSMSDLPFLETPTRRSVDATPIREASPAALDDERVAAHIASAIERGRYRGPTDPEGYLRHKQCIVTVDGESYATLAGLLCFGYDPQALLPRAVIDIGHYHGLQSLSYEVVHLEKDIGGTIFDQLARVESYLWTNTHHGMTLNETSFQRVEVHEYPRVIIRELGVNMLAHRDYNNFLSAARVLYFRNRIEWVSPGGLPPGITIENLLAEQASRNPIILSILYEAGYVEAFGQGLDTVVAVLEHEQMPPAQFKDTGASFIVTVYGRALDVEAGEGIYGRFNGSQRRILSLLRVREEISLRELTSLMEDRSRRSIQRDLSGLIEASLITVDGEGRALRYRIAFPPTIRS